MSGLPVMVDLATLVHSTERALVVDLHAVRCSPPWRWRRPSVSQSVLPTPRRPSASENDVLYKAPVQYRLLDRNR